ncbi:hypothetical protein PHIN9_07180 [Polynucleobacter sp. HIN9]|nr:hypothetical protein PHIN9_07180 [Polynucleobacter sp. HIN9]
MTREEETSKLSAQLSRNDMWVYRSEELFGSTSAIQINHHGVIYILRITQLGKLILTK